MTTWTATHWPTWSPTRGFNGWRSWDDGSNSEGIAVTFSAGVEPARGQNVARTALNPEVRAFTDTVEAMKNANSQAVFFGGLNTEGGPCRCI